MDKPYQDVIDAVAGQLGIEPTVVALFALSAHRKRECTCTEVGWCTGAELLRKTDTVVV